MGSAASTAYALGQETTGSSTVGAGIGGIARAASNAARERVSSTLGIDEASAQGSSAAWMAFNRTGSKAASTGASATGGEPEWARAMRTQQTGRHHHQAALHALQQGDRGGASAHPDIKERDE
jgi:type IV secretion system protein TrbL